MVDGHSFETTMVRALKMAISPTDSSCVLLSFSPFLSDPQPQATTDLLFVITSCVFLKWAISGPTLCDLLVVWFLSLSSTHFKKCRHGTLRGAWEFELLQVCVLLEGPWALQDAPRIITSFRKLVRSYHVVFYMGFDKIICVWGFTKRRRMFFFWHLSLLPGKEKTDALQSQQWLSALDVCKWPCV